LIKNGTHKKKILIIQTRPGIGDMCVFFPCIKEIGKKYHDYDLHILTKKRSCAKELLKNEKSIKKIIYLPKAKGLNFNYQIFKVFKKEKYRICFIMHYSLRYYLIAMLAKVNKIFSYGILKKNENIVKKSQIATRQWLNEKKILFDPIINFRTNNKINNQISIGIGGSGKNKKWAVEKYIKLIKMIIKKRKDVKILLAGGKNEIFDAKQIKQSLGINGKNIKTTCDLNIEHAIKSLSYSKLYIGNDTGFMHISGSMGLKTFGLFGDTPINYSSYNKKIVPITPNDKKNISHGSKMMSKIEPEFVFNKIKKYL
jgi:heptosyltransferase-2